MQFQVSIKRINKFLLSEEINDYMIEYKPENFNSEDHVWVLKSNYFWGFPIINEDEFDKEKKIIAMNLNVEQEQKRIEVKKFEEMVCLKSINVQVKRGEFVAIIGEIGSGKSSLISALIGDMLYVDDETLMNNWQQDISAETQNVIELLNHAIKVANSNTVKNPPIKINGTVSLVE